jgi:hypothetical protein
MRSRLHFYNENNYALRDLAPPKKHNTHNLMTFADFDGVASHNDEDVHDSFFFLFPTTRLFAVWNYCDCSRSLSPYPNTAMCREGILEATEI